MKKMIGIMSILLIGVFLFSIPANAIPTVNLNMPVFPIYEGDVFDVGVFADGVDLLSDGELIAFGFDVVYSPSFFSYNGATVAFPFDDSGLLPNTDVAGSVGSGLGFSGDDIFLATLSFTAVQVGTDSLGIISDPLDLNEGLLFFPSFSTTDIDQSNRVTVEPAPVPEPATLLLLGTGFIGLVSYRRAKNKGNDLILK